ncbi:MAG: tripartite tricarboxylate transporter substrate binding protein [Bradyrhizobium sp.]
MRRMCSALAAVAAAVLVWGASALAQDWPVRPVRIVNTFAAGGAADILARMVADHLSVAFKQQFFVETRAGAGGVLGLQSVVHSEPDGYNFAITSVAHLVISPVTNAHIGYDPIKGLTNVAFIAGSPIVFVVNPSIGVNTLGDFVGRGKKGKPLTYSSSGIGSNGQLVAELFAQVANTNFEHVPYKGASQGITDLLGGHIAFSSQTVSSTSAYIRSGTLIPLAHSADQRLADYPDVPTFKELGYPDLVTTTWFALSGPAGLPKEIGDRLNREIIKIMAKPEVQKKIREDGQVTQPMTPDSFNQFLRQEITRWKPVIVRAGLASK